MSVGFKLRISRVLGFAAEQSEDVLVDAALAASEAAFGEGIGGIGVGDQGEPLCDRCGKASLGGCMCEES